MEAIRTHNLDGVVIASCSPKLHLETFRVMAQRAGINPYMYTPGEHPRAVLLGAPARHAEGDRQGGAPGAGRHRPRGVEPTARQHSRRDAAGRSGRSVPGAAGMRAALALSDLGLSVYVVERAAEVGWDGIRTLGKLFPSGRPGSDVVASLREQIAGRDNIVVYTNAELVEKSGSAGRFAVKVQSGVRRSFSLKVGAIIAATGFDPLTLRSPEGIRIMGCRAVVTLPEFNELLTASRGANQASTAATCAPSPMCTASAAARARATSTVRATAARRPSMPPSRRTEIDPEPQRNTTFTATCGTYGRNELHVTRKPGRKGSVFVRFDERRAA